MGLPPKRIPLARIRVKGKQRKNIDLRKWGIADATINVDVYTDDGNTIVEIEGVANKLDNPPQDVSNPQ
jgi:hypothetical protein